MRWHLRVTPSGGAAAVLCSTVHCCDLQDCGLFCAVPLLRYCAVSCFSRHRVAWEYCFGAFGVASTALYATSL